MESKSDFCHVYYIIKLFKAKWPQLIYTQRLMLWVLLYRDHSLVSPNKFFHVASSIFNFACSSTFRDYCIKSHQKHSCWNGPKCGSACSANKSLKWRSFGLMRLRGIAGALADARRPFLEAAEERRSFSAFVIVPRALARESTCRRHI
jgi:hypothetical protein